MASATRPWGFHWRSKRSFIIAAVAFGLFTDLVLYGIIVPILPFFLRDRFHIPVEKLQSHSSGLLAIYSGSSVLFSVPAGWTASKIGSRQLFLTGLALLLASSAMFAFARHISVLVISRVMQGMSTAVVWTAGLDMVQGAVPAGEIGEAIGTIFASISAGELVSPVAGGIIYDWGGVEGIFAVSAVLLVVDFILRILVIDGIAAAEYKNDAAIRDDEAPAHNGAATETDPLLGARAHQDGDALNEPDLERYKIHGEIGRVFKVMPILYCFREPRLHMAMHLSFAQAMLIGALDATVPLEAQLLFGFEALQVGLVFIALMLPYLTLGRYFGQAVDKYGTRTVTTVSYLYLIPCFLLLGLPGRRVVGGNYNIALFCAVLAVNGVGLAAVSSPAFVEAIDIIGKYESANPELFGKNGPYAQLFGFNSVYFFSGLGVGPLVGGGLRLRFGYEVMGAAFAVASFLTALVSFFMLKPQRKSNPSVISGL